MAPRRLVPASIRARELSVGSGTGGRGDYVLYWMQSSQRVLENPALEYAVERANQLSLPVVVGFGLTPELPGVSFRHYTFMLEGLAEAGQELERRGLRLAILRASPDEAALRLGRRAALIVTDRGYLRRHRRWHERVISEAPCPVVRVEGNVVVPVETASAKNEWSAATFRPRIHRALEGFLGRTPVVEPRRDSLGLALDLPILTAGPELLSGLDIEAAPGPVSDRTRGGTSEALRRLERFCSGPLREYHTRRNDPGLELQSGLSPYLHFGQISPITVALAVRDTEGAPEEARAAFLEELIVRRELSFNYVHYEERYEGYEALPEWARKTLAEHSRDPRPYLYSPQALESGATHDPYWNAAMTEMRATGSMHGYMRMYWGKKILEWSATPQQGFAALITLNDRYFLDGRDPNSYAGAAWCFGKHDRPWQERPVFGKVRSMTAGGLRRKFDMDAYLRRVEALPTPG